MTDPEERRHRKWTWIILMGAVSALAIAYWTWPGFRGFLSEVYGVFSSGEQEQIRAWVEGFGAWKYPLLLGLMLLQTVMAVIPSFLLMIVAVIAFGPVTGGVLAWIGLLMAATLGYGIGRGLGVAAVDRLIGEKTERKMRDLVERYGTWAVVAARVSPALSTDAVSVVAGVTQMRFVRFILATGAGTLPLTLFVAWLGAEAGRMKTGLVWVSVISLLVFAVYVVWDRRRSRTSDEEP